MIAAQVRAMKTAGKMTNRSAAETLISASLAAQAGLVGHARGPVIPAVAESPIPVLPARHRTPDPRSGGGRDGSRCG